MNPIDFDGVNRILGKPDGMTDEECVSLPVMVTEDQIYSVWQPTDDERKAIAEGAPVGLSVFTTAGTQPPVCLFVPVDEG